MQQDALKNYLKSLQEKLAAGDSTEHTHRAALEHFVQAFDKTLQISNEPKRIKVGQPDLVVRKKIARNELLPVGYIETKDIGDELAKTEKSEQLVRYLQLPNLILTDYLEFRWYVKGVKRDTVKFAEKSGKKIKLLPEGEAKLAELIKSFLAEDVRDINTPKDLAARMAGLCKNIDRVITQTFAAGEPSELMQDLKSAFERTLLPDITDAQFADMFAQTLGYGLFAARIQHAEARQIDPPLPPRRTGGESDFTRTGAAREIPKSNPFLRDLFYTIHSPQLEDEPFVGFVDDLTAVLAHTDISAVLKHFGKRTKQEDPILHFYETFLSEYDPKERKRRGVYYTPEPVVSYIVRSVDILLKEKFGLADGLADTSTIEVEVKEGEKFVKKTLPKVLILDPACGTGTFLYAVVDLIRNRFMERNDAGSWQMFVRDHLIPRIYGFELQMAPYAVAHLKLAMQLAGHDLEPELRETWGYEIEKDQRLNVLLTNSLEYTEEKIQMEFGFIERAIAEEARAAQAIKGELPIMVVMGNPPYSNFGKSNRNPWIIGLEEDYKKGVEVKKWNSDDYIKFIRFCQWRIERSGNGIVGLITNSGFIDDVTRSGMRRSLLETFDGIAIYDLKGSTLKGHSQIAGEKDENVFDIMQGVCISLLTRGGTPKSRFVRHAELYGRRSEKYKVLSESSVSNTNFIDILPIPEHYFFVPKSSEGVQDWDAYREVNKAFTVVGPGVKTERDKISIHFTRSSLQHTVNDFRNMKIEEIRTAYELGEDSRDWSIERAKADVQANKGEEYFKLIQYRPFDVRHIWYSGKSKGFIGTPGARVSSNLIEGNNLGLVTVKQQSQGNVWNLIGSTRFMAECCAISNKTREINYLFPLYLYPEDGSARKPNLDAKFVAEFGEKLGLTFVEEGGKWITPPNPPAEARGDQSREILHPKRVQDDRALGRWGRSEFGPEDVFYYIYAVFHSPTYRERYKEFLKIDFPRVPLTSDLALFGKLVPLGYELVQYHLLEHTKLEQAPVVFPVTGDFVVDKVRYDDQHQRVYINKTQYFEKVPQAVWEFHVGGYQVCQKWLKDRKQRALSFEDIRHYAKTVMALGETIRLMQEIDQAIVEWPIK